MTQPSLLELHGLRKTFRRSKGAEVVAVDNVALRMDAGELVVLLGPSGCGKTTLLRCVAGLEQPDEGRIDLAGEMVFSSGEGIEVPPERRRIGMVFQSYALWPHMTVAENVGYSLKMAKLGRAEIETRVRRMLDMMRISELEPQYPGQISGGQQQRVALARALVRGDNLILFDEPLSNVDAKVREHLRLELLAMQRELGFAGLYVTHDQEEAMGLATKVAVVSEGRILQLGTPQDVYHRPAGLKVARFVGSTNQLDGTLKENGAIETALGPVSLPKESLAGLQGPEIALITRPEQLEISTEALQGGLCWQGRVRASAFLGSHDEYLVELDGGNQLRVWQQGTPLLPAGTKVWCRVDPQSIVALDRNS